MNMVTATNYYLGLIRAAEQTTPDHIGANIKQALKKCKIYLMIMEPTIHQEEIKDDTAGCIYEGWERAGIIERTRYTKQQIREALYE
jgi:hypothetical protein